MQVGKKSAPHFSEIKGYYLIDYPKKEEFVKGIVNFLKNPSKENAKLQNAVKNYKQVMPKLEIDPDILKDIATYLYETDEF